MSNPIPSTGTTSSLFSQMEHIVSNCKNIENDIAARTSLLQLSRKLTLDLEEPLDVVSSLAYAGVQSTCVRIASDLKLFDLLSEESPRSVSELAAATGAEEALVLRLLRTLAALRYVEQVDPESFAATRISQSLTLPNVKAGVRFFFDQWGPVLTQTPAYFENNGYRLPENLTDGPFQFAHSTEEDCYTFWSRQPGVMPNFNTFMRGRFETRARPHWADWFPLQNMCLEAFDGSRSEYCFVDMGGGRGQESELVLHRNPNANGKFVLQDLPVVLDDVTKLDSRIEKVPHDFSTPQPIKGARTYFLKNVLHNWPASHCRTILSHIHDAMLPEYSRLLIVNIILPDQHATLRACEMDMGLLFVHSGGQRSAREWRDFVESVGLEIAKFWYPPDNPGADGVVEVRRPAR